MFLLVLTASVLAIASSQAGLCPAPNGDFANPSSELCTTFFRCIQGNPALLRCPANQRFDFLFRICRPQRLVDCNNQLQVFAAPAASSGLGGPGNGAGAFAGNGGLAGLGGLGGSQLGAGLPDGGLFTLLSQLGANEGDSQNGSNSLTTLLLMSALMNKKNTANQQGSLTPIGGVYPANPIASAVLPAEHLNPSWQQLTGPYSTPVGGVASQGATITMSDGKTYNLVPQVQGQGNAVQWRDAQIPGLSQYAGLSQLLFPGQNAPQSYASLLDNGVLQEAGQTLLQSLISKPAGKGENTETPSTPRSPLPKKTRKSKQSILSNGTARRETL